MREQVVYACYNDRLTDIFFRELFGPVLPIVPVANTETAINYVNSQ